ncbi:hypothetical protein AAG906_040072 [Vitis piasezkii]
MSEDEQVVAAQHENNTMLWHKRLGHFHHNVVLYMKKNQIVKGLPDLEEELPICTSFSQKKNMEINTETTIGSHRCWWTSEGTILEMDSKKQEVVAQSTTKAEYIVAITAINQALWLRKLLTYLDIKQEVSTQVFIDNQATISIANDPFFHDLSFYEKDLEFAAPKSRRSVESYALVSAERKAAIINYMQLKSTRLLECRCYFYVSVLLVLFLCFCF